MSEITTISVELVGTSPLLMNNFEKSMKAQAEAKASVKKVPLPEVEAESKVYRTDDGFLYLPAIAFKGALVSGAKQQRIGKIAATTVIKGSVFPAHEKAVLFDPESGDKLTEYEIDIRRAVVQRQGVMRARPRIERWATEVTFEIDTDFIDPSLVLSTLDRAGRMAGVGDFRPERGGSFGRFTVKS